MFIIINLKLVDSSGIEPELFWTKTRRVTNYTMSHLVDVAGIEPALPALGDIPPASGQTISRPFTGVVYTQHYDTLVNLYI